MTYFPECAATDEGPGAQFDPIQSHRISVPSGKEVTLREAAKRMTTMSKLQRETASFHEDMARKHGLHTSRGLHHFKAAKAYREGSGKLMEFFNEKEQPGQDPTQSMDPKAVHDVHDEAMKFHERCAKKHGLDTPEGAAHVAFLQHHQAGRDQAKKKLNQQKQQKKQAKMQQQQAAGATAPKNFMSKKAGMNASAGGAKGRQSPVPVPKKSQQPNQDVRQNWKPTIKIGQKKMNASGLRKPNQVTETRRSL